ncbi:MAG TPA: isoprenylcysteine carboxylmethyltransferase family protein [Pyrinomonadaceae bacterium]|nr:isoprenylcysteine carboxylmethyltransferase family protein [Pyrinomonadaceae bacterium]
MKDRLLKGFQRLRVFSGFAVSVIYLIFAEPKPALLAIGLVFAITGLIIRAWASGHIRKINELETSGPYSFTRNPLYFGTLLIIVGFAICSGKLWISVLAIAYFLFAYLPVIAAESNELKQTFGESFIEYEKNVPELIPRLKPYRRNSERSFDFGLYLKNGEYNAAIGFFIAVVFLIVRINGWI